MPQNPCVQLPDYPGMYVGVNIENEYVWISLHDNTSTSSWHMPPSRALDLADAIYDLVTAHTATKLAEAADD